MAQMKQPGDVSPRHHPLIEVLRSALPLETECQTYLPRLEEYIGAQLAGEDYLARYADIAMHLDRCVTCADTYARLYELEIALATGSLPAPEAMPTPDLSFLPMPPAQSGHTRRERLLDRLAQALRVTASTIRLQLADDLLAMLQPPQPTALTRSSDDLRYHEVLYEVQPEQLPANAAAIRLVVYRDALYPEQCLVEVSVMLPGVTWPNLGGYRVTLQRGQESTVQMTDVWGVAAFADIPIAHLNAVALEVDLAQ